MELPIINFEAVSWRCFLTYTLRNGSFLDLHLVMVLLHSHWYKDGIRIGTLFAGIDFLCCLGQT